MVAVNKWWLLQLENMRVQRNQVEEQPSLTSPFNSPSHPHWAWVPQRCFQSSSENQMPWSTLHPIGFLCGFLLFLTLPSWILRIDTAPLILTVTSAHPLGLLLPLAPQPMWLPPPPLSHLANSHKDSSNAWNLLSPNYVTEICRINLIYPSWQPCKVNTIVIPILQLKKLKYQKIVICPM